MSDNSNLTRAKAVGDDEFYTRMADIEAEVSLHAAFFRGKVVYCNCDDPRISNFFHYFKDNFKRYGLKKLITTHYKCQTTNLLSLDDVREKPIKTETDADGTVRYVMDGNGDFRSWECQDLLAQADVVVTNPPFSLFRAHVRQTRRAGKKFLLVGPISAGAYSEVFPYMMTGETHLGYTPPRFNMFFDRPDGRLSHIAAGWYTNIELTSWDHRWLDMTEKYTPEKYPRYDNVNAIEVRSITEVPMDYPGVMGVPINFFGCYNPSQFEIIASGGLGIDPTNEYGKNPILRGKNVYRRILIRNRHPVSE